MLKQKIGNLKCLDKQWGASIYRPAHPGNLAARAKHLQRTSLSNKKLKDEWENDVENDSFGDYQNGVITCMVLLDRWSEENAHVLAQSFAKIRKGKDADLRHWYASLLQ